MYKCDALILSQVIVQFQPSSIPDEWGTTQDDQTRPRVVKRGIDDDHEDIPDGKLCRISYKMFPYLFSPHMSG